MKQSTFLAFLAFSFLTLNVVSQTGNFSLPKSKYGLPIVKDPKIYKEIVRLNPDDELVDMREFLPSAQFDVTYASTNNDFKKPLYESADVFMRKPAALALEKANEILKEKGLGLILFDGYRPYSVTVIFYERHPDTTYVADPRKGSRHNRGMAIDLSLYDLKTGKRLPMPSAYDESSPRAFHSYQEGDPQALKNREILKEAMLNAGFSIYPWEWWHYDFKGWDNCYTYDLPHSVIKKANDEIHKKGK
jgi:D-alanyl-D-alanine dipeptidase